MGEKLIGNQPELRLNASRFDLGLYVCRAANGLGNGLEKQIQIKLYGKSISLKFKKDNAQVKLCNAHFLIRKDFLARIC